MSRADGNGGLWLGLLAIVVAVGVAVALTVGSDDTIALEPASGTTEQATPAPGGALSPGLSTPAITPTAPTPAPAPTPTTPKTTPTAPSPKTTPTTTTGG